jgi:hypothetical protein
MAEDARLVPEEVPFWRQGKVQCGLFVIFLVVSSAAVVVGVSVALGANGSSGDGGGGNKSSPVTPSPVAVSPSPVPPVDATPSPTSSSLVIFKEQLPLYSQEALLDADSPQAEAFAWLGGDPFVSTYSEFKKLQRYALATLYYAAGGEMWINSAGWLDYSVDECGWFTSYPNDCILGRFKNEITLVTNGLVGTLPKELALLTDLETVVLQSSLGLKGSIPLEYGLLTNLGTLDLFANGLTGTLPTELGHLKALWGMDVLSNSLRGPIPAELLSGWNEIRYLQLHGNSRVRGGSDVKSLQSRRFQELIGRADPK